jgi:hypothetical protein
MAVGRGNGRVLWLLPILAAFLADTAVIRDGTILPRLGNVSLQQLSVFIVDFWGLIAREWARLTTAKKWFVSH